MLPKAVVIVFYFQQKIETDLENGTHCLRLQLTVVHKEFQVFVKQDLQQEDQLNIFIIYHWMGVCNRYGYCIWYCSAQV